MTVRALFFDVFGTLVDWRTGVARESEAVLRALGHDLDWLGFADAWRGEYQPAMEEVRAGRLPFSKLDALELMKQTGDVAQNINFAVQGSIARLFLDAQGVRVSERPSTGILAAGDVADGARTFTYQVECRP